MRNRLKKPKPVHGIAALAAAGAVIACLGVALIYLPAALIIGGIGTTLFALFIVDVKS